MRHSLVDCTYEWEIILFASGYPRVLQRRAWLLQTAEFDQQFQSRWKWLVMLQCDLILIPRRGSHDFNGQRTSGPANLTLLQTRTHSETPWPTSA